jgi:NTP pyrophosphatase (non-canonical NTP hydrolase)
LSFQERTRDFIKHHGLGHTPQTHALDLMSEVGEVAKSLLQASDYGRSPLELSAALSEELGDAFYSLVALAESLNVDLETALYGALTKYEARLAIQGHAGSARPPQS